MDAPLLTGLGEGGAGVGRGLDRGGVPGRAVPGCPTSCTPVAVLDDAALTANIDRMAAWCAEPRGGAGAARQDLDGTGTVAASVGLPAPGASLSPRPRSCGWRSPPGCPGSCWPTRWSIRWRSLGSAAAGADRPELTVWADSVATVAAMDAVLERVRRHGRSRSWWSSGPRAPGPGPGRSPRPSRWPRRWPRARTCGSPASPAGRVHWPWTPRRRRSGRVREFLRRDGRRSTSSC